MHIILLGQLSNHFTLLSNKLFCLCSFNSTAIGSDDRMNGLYGGLVSAFVSFVFSFSDVPRYSPRHNRCHWQCLKSLRAPCLCTPCLWSIPCLCSTPCPWGASSRQSDTLVWVSLVGCQYRCRHCRRLKDDIILKYDN